MIDYKKFYEAGMPLLPVTLPDKVPVNGLFWGDWQEGVAQDVYEDFWMRNPDAAGAIMCGKYQVIDVDAKNDPDGQILDLFDQALRDQLDPWTYSALVVETSPSGGRHYWYKVSDSMVMGNLNLAKIKYTDDDRFVLGYPPERKSGVIIETRGLRGYCLCHPSPGYDEIQGTMFDVRELEDYEVDLILQVARSFNRFVDDSEIVNIPPIASGTRPGDYYNRDVESADVVDILQRNGWTVLRKMRNKVFFNRPGSGTPRACHADLCTTTRTFISYTTNETVFKPGWAYRYFSVYSILEHGGNFTQAAQALKPLAEKAKAVEDATIADASVDELLRGRFSIHRKPTNTFNFYVQQRSGTSVRQYGVGFPGALVSISGIEKSRKTALTLAIAGAGLRKITGVKISNADRFPFIFKSAPGPLLLIDTEQPDVWFWEGMRKVMVQGGLKEDSNDLVGVSMADELPPDRCLKTDALVRAVKPGLIVLDGVSDFVWDPNDQKEAMTFYLRFLRPWQATGAMVIVVIHNSKDESLRGHLGKLVQRKGDSVFVATADGDNFVDIQCKFSRGERPDAFRLAVGPYNILMDPSTPPDYDIHFGLDRVDQKVADEPIPEFNPSDVPRPNREIEEDFPF